MNIELSFILSLRLGLVKYDSIDMIIKTINGSKNVIET
jgi:hypothetical protein